jgi:hypothetical protein
MKHRVLALGSLAIAAAVLAACTASGGTAAPTPGIPTPSASPTETPAATPQAPTVILRITSEGGFISPAANLNAVPPVSVYADGRIFTPGPVLEIYPGPLVPTVTVRDLGAAGAGAIIEAIRAAGLDKAGNGGGIVADSGASVFAVTLDGRTVVTRFGLGGGPGGPGAPGGGTNDPARAAALDLLTRLTDASETWGQPAPQAVTFDPTAYRIFVAPGAPPVDPAVAQEPVAWPLATGLDAFGIPAVPDRGIAGLRQGIVFGADAATLKPLLDAATVATPFASGGSSYTLYVRPLLPDEMAGAQ